MRFNELCELDQSVIKSQFYFEYYNKTIDLLNSVTSRGIYDQEEIHFSFNSIQSIVKLLEEIKNNIE